MAENAAPSKSFLPELVSTTGDPSASKPSLFTWNRTTTRPFLPSIASSGMFANHSLCKIFQYQNRLSRATEDLAAALAIRQTKRADLGSVVGLARLQVVADIPERAVVARIHGRRRVIFPTQRIFL